MTSKGWTGLLILAVISFVLWGLAKPKPVVAETGVGLLGDLDDDGMVTQNDHRILANYILTGQLPESSPLNEAEFRRRADINGDGQINVLDLTNMVKLIGGHV